MLQMVDGKINQIIPHQSIWWFTVDGVAAEIVSGVVISVIWSAGLFPSYDSTVSVTVTA